MSKSIGNDLIGLSALRDVHHGNGIQDIFYDDPSVLYVSIHRGGFEQVACLCSKADNTLTWRFGGPWRSLTSIRAQALRTSKAPVPV